MCANCDAEVERIRPVVDQIIDKARRNVAVIGDDYTASQNIVGCANMLLDLHLTDDGGLTPIAVRTLCVEFGTVILRLLALEQLSGIDAT
jgi:hypothetical protein